MAGQPLRMDCNEFDSTCKIGRSKEDVHILSLFQTHTASYARPPAQYINSNRFAYLLSRRQQS